MGNMFKCALKQGGSGGSGAVLIVTCSSEFAGATITAVNGLTTLTQVCPSSAPYTVEFQIPNSGTWTVSGVVDGTTYSENILVTLDYMLTLQTGLNFKAWIDLSQTLDSSDYASLSDVFADEEATRELMLIHDCVDYLAATITNDLTILDDFAADDTAMKWLGLCDYATDKIVAIPGAEAKLLNSLYWERYLKDHVPVMTSNSAPFGTASASTTAGSQSAYRAFDGLGSDWWSSNNTNVNQYITYDFTNPINVKKLSLSGRRATSSVDQSPKDFRLLGSNDDWNTSTEIGSFTYDGNSNIDALEVQDFDVTNDDYYKSLRIAIDTVQPSNNNVISINLLQFYGRSLDVSVPVMTSNTLPYGEASASGANSGYEAYKAFSPSGYWVTSGASAWIQYHFTSKMCPKMLDIQCGSGSRIATYSLKGSNDGSDFTNEITNGTNSTSGTVRIIKSFLDNTDEFEYLRLAITSNESASGEITQMQFYGVDYSEKEFEQGTTKKWLYDHGVELETMRAFATGGTATVSKNDNDIYLKSANSQGAIASNDTAIDLTNYSLLRAKTDPIYTTSSAFSVLAVMNVKPTSFSQFSALAYCDNTAVNRYTLGIDISSFNAEYYCASYLANSSSYGEWRLLELWLE